MSDDDTFVFPVTALGASGGAILGAYASHRRPSVWGSAVGAAIPALIGTLTRLGISTDQEPTGLEFAVLWSCGFFTFVGALVGAHSGL